MTSWLENLQTIATAAGILSGSGYTESEELVSRVLDTNGNGSGVTSATGDYSSTPETFFIQPPAGAIYRINRMLISFEDAGSFDSGLYGNNIILTNGITVTKENDSGVMKDLMDGHPILTNGNWGSLCFDVDLLKFGSGNEHLNVRWTFGKYGAPIDLIGDNNERLVVNLNDNFGGLVAQHFFANGIILSE